MKKLLLLQFRTDDSAQQERVSFEREALDDGTYTIDILNAYTDSADWENPKGILENYDGLVMGGSGEFHFTGHDCPTKEEKFSTIMDRVSPLLQYVVANDYPTLGVCFGHQMLAHYLGVKIVVDESQAKAGSHELEILEEDPLFHEVPKSFIAQYGHKGSLAELPKDAILLANGAKCKYGAFKYKQNIYGVQFHPEMNRDDTIHKMQLYPEYRKNDPHFEQNTKPSPHAPFIIRNFAKGTRKK